MKKVNLYLKRCNFCRRYGQHCAEVIIDLGNHFQTAITTTNLNLLFQLILAEDRQIDDIHKTIHYIDILDQTVKTAKREKTVPDQTLKGNNYSNYNRNCSYSNSRTRHYSNDRSQNSSTNQNRIYSYNRHRSHSNKSSRN